MRPSGLNRRLWFRFVLVLPPYWPSLGRWGTGIDDGGQAKEQIPERRGAAGHEWIARVAVCCGWCSSAPPGRFFLGGTVNHGLRCAPPRGYSPWPLRGLEDRRPPVEAIGVGHSPRFLRGFEDGRFFCSGRSVRATVFGSVGVLKTTGFSFWPLSRVRTPLRSGRSAHPPRQGASCLRSWCTAGSCLPDW